VQKFAGGDLIHPMVREDNDPMTPNPSSMFFSSKKGLRLNAENCRSRGNGQPHAFIRASGAEENE